MIMNQGAVKVRLYEPNYIIVRDLPNNGGLYLCSGNFKSKENALKELEKRKQFLKANSKSYDGVEVDGSEPVGWGDPRVVEIQVTVKEVK